VSQGQVFVTETRDQESEIVRSLDRETGQELWRAEWKGALSVPFFAKTNGDWIRATPAYDENRLYVAGMRDVLVCLHADSGKQLWRVDFAQQIGTPLPSFGFVSSPLIVGDHLYVQAGASFVKLDKKTGRVIWRSLEDGGGMLEGAFSSPTFATLAGEAQLLVQTRQLLAGVEPESGKVLWSQEVPAFRGMNILTPTVFGDSVFTSAYGGRSFLYTISRQGEAFAADEAWSNKVQGYMSTPVVIEGHAYLHLRNQRFTCIDLTTGESKWTTTPYGKYWSLVAREGRVLALDERGELLLIRANPDEYELLDTRTVSQQPTWAHLAVCGGELYIRELNAIASYRWR
jgi:outer membrane protein assembly factor BamB